MKNIEERNLIVPELSGSPSGANLLLSNVGLARTVIKEKYDASACAQGIGLSLITTALDMLNSQKLHISQMNNLTTLIVFLSPILSRHLIFFLPSTINDYNVLNTRLQPRA